MVVLVKGVRTGPHITKAGDDAPSALVTPSQGQSRRKVAHSARRCGSSPCPRGKRHRKRLPLKLRATDLVVGDSDRSFEDRKGQRFRMNSNKVMLGLLVLQVQDRVA